MIDTETTTVLPQLHRSVFLAEGVQIMGAVAMGEEASIWYNAVVRGDTENITIGKQTNIQDLCVLHADPGVPCKLGDRVTVGHGAVIHGAIIEDDVMIGIRSVILNGARIGSGSVIAAGAVVAEGTDIPPNSVVMGVPGKVKRTAEQRDQDRIRHAAKHYVKRAKQELALRTPNRS